MTLFEEFKLYENMWEPLTEAVYLEALPTKPGIYCIIFNAYDSEGKAVQRKYIGLAKDIRARIQEHLKAARPDGRDYVVYNAMRKHPYKVIVLETLDIYNITALGKLEKKWIQDLHTFINDNAENDNIKTVNFNGRNYDLTCSGPGYNMTFGGEGAPCYPPEIIDEIIALYKTNEYQHVKTYKEFKEKYKAHPQYSKLSYDTLRLFIEANDLPWYNEQEKKTVVYANIVKQGEKLEKDGHKRSCLIAVKNTTDSKYRIVCDSQAQADALVDFIWKRFKADYETEFKTYLATRTKRERENSGAMRIKWIIEQGLYDKYLDLSQYDISAIKSTKKSLGGEGQTGIKIATGRGSLCSIAYNAE